MRDPVRISRTPLPKSTLPKSTLLGFSKSAFLNLLGGFFIGVSFMGAIVAVSAIMGAIEFNFLHIDTVATGIATVTPSAPIENEMDTVLSEPLTVILPVTATPTPTETATATITPDFAATATSACGDFLEQFPGTPCPE